MRCARSSSCAVPGDRLVSLDYYCENTEVWRMTDRYYGKPYIWCYLGNFGGNTMLKGNLRETGRRIERPSPKAAATFADWVPRSKLSMSIR